MSVELSNDTHADAFEDWRIVRATAAGERAVKAARERYLPRPNGMEDGDFDAYLKRAAFFNATARTIDGLSGMVFRKPPLTEEPDEMGDIIADVTATGIGLQAFAETVVEEVLTVGRAGAIVDWPNTDTDMTVAEFEASGIRPFWRLYKAEDIFAWQTGTVNSQPKLIQVRLNEQVTEPGSKEFVMVDVEQIRVLELVDGQYQQRLFRKDEDTNEWEQHGETIVPLRNGQPLDFIPFVFFGPRDTTSEIDRPPLLDLANVNLSHYRNSADLEHGAHFVGLPTPYVFGINDDDVPTSVGPTRIWSAQNPDVKVGLLEFTGQGLGAIERLLDRKEQQMAVLGARMITPEKRGIEAAETAQIHRTGENSVLSSISQAVSLGLTRLATITRDWMGASGDVSIELNRDFFPAPMSPEMLTALVRALQGGTVSSRTFFDNLQRGEIVEAGRTFEDEQAEIETTAPLGANIRAVA